MLTSWRWLWSLTLCFWFTAPYMHDSVAVALPILKHKAAAGIEVPPPEILRFMRRFGYLEPNPNDSEALYHESAIIEAIKNIQKYGALNQTGMLDNQTLDLFSMPRCGVPDIEGVPYYLAASTTQSSIDNAKSRKRTKRFVIGARPWSKRRIRYFIANWSLKIPAEQVERDIARALALWARYSGLHFQRINDTSADIIVGFGTHYHGDNYPFDGPGNILAHAYYPYELGSWGGDLHFDEDEAWKENATDLNNGVDFYSVALHELGHSLGLAHSPVYSSIMFPYYKGPEHNTLHDDDTLAMYEMYMNKKLDDDNEDGNGSFQEATTANGTESTTVQSKLTTTVPTQTTELTPTFHGDYETITEHKTRYAYITPSRPLPSTSTPRSPVTQSLWPSTSSKKPPFSDIPNICQGYFDAVAVLNGSVHIFKRDYVWKLTERYTIDHGYPRRIREVFPFLPGHVKQIDAAYSRYDNMGVLFTDQSFWVFNGSDAIEGSPKPLTDLIGNAAIVLKLDAAMMWPKNNYTYLFADDRFWRYNDRLRMLDVGYPKMMQRWPGIPRKIDAVATLPNGKTYFFKNNLYWLYNNAELRPERGYPRRASTAWLGCAIPNKTTLRNFNTTVSFISASVSASAST